MNQSFKLLVIAFVSVVLASCNQMETKLETFKKERERIKKEVGSGQLDSLEFDGGMCWLKNGKIEKIYIYQGDGENISIHEEFFLIEDQVFAIEKRHDNYPDGIHYEAHVIFNDSLIVHESYWLNDKSVTREFIESDLKDKGLLFSEEILKDGVSLKIKGVLHSKDLCDMFDIQLSDTLAAFKKGSEPDENLDASKFFNGQQLKAGEKIVKVEWDGERKTSFTRDREGVVRFSSSTQFVPSGKTWILIYINEEYTYADGDVWESVPYLFIDDEQAEYVRNRDFSEESAIHIARARDQNWRFYSGSSIRAVSNRAQNEVNSAELTGYKGFLWFLEIPE